MRTGIACKREKELLDISGEDFKEREMSKGAQSDREAGGREVVSKRFEKAKKEKPMKVCRTRRLIRKDENVEIEQELEIRS